MYTEECGRSFCGAAKLVKAMHLIRGDRLYVSDGKNSFVEVLYIDRDIYIYIDIDMYRYIYICIKCI